MTNFSTKLPSDVDRHVGARVRLRRHLLGMSQSALAERLGVSFQQVQKYEKGSNRIGASRLAQIAAALGVGVAFFYEGASPDAEGLDGEGASRVLAGFLGLPEAARLMQAFAGIEEPALRARLVELAETLAGARAEEEARRPAGGASAA